MKPINVSASLERAERQGLEARGISSMATHLVGSEILKIASEIRALVASGEKVLNLTVGDFSSTEFPIPSELVSGISRALHDGHTNYPPSDGVLECREAVRQLFVHRMGLDYPLESVLIAGGSRPMIAGTYLALLNPGDAVIYGVPSWNNNHYCTLSGAERVEVRSHSVNGFFPHPDDIVPHIDRARLLCLNTPQNPTGTVMGAKALDAICRLIVEENRRRQQSGRPALYLMYDQVYWMLTFRGAAHANPVSLVPEIAPYTIFVDGISKALSATGLRVGWAVGPTDVIKRISAILTHVGAWAPRAEQIATANVLRDHAAVDRHIARMNGELLARLDLLTSGIAALKQQGFNVDVIAPQGAIYMSMQVNLLGKKAEDGTRLESDEDVRRFLLRAAGIAVVPFQAFGLREDSGWFRASVGAVSKADCEGIGHRLRTALERLR